MYDIPDGTADAINSAKAKGGRIIAVGTTVVRALESSVQADGRVLSGNGVARNRIGRETRLRVADAILTGMHRPGESHFELLRAFADDLTLDRMYATAVERGYRGHEFGDSLLVERRGRNAGDGYQIGVSGTGSTARCPRSPRNVGLKAGTCTKPAFQGHLSLNQ